MTNLIYILYFGMSFLNTTDFPPNTKTLIGGKWAQCIDYKLNRDYDCHIDHGHFEFFKDNTYKQHEEFINDGKKYLFETGTWSLNGSILIIDPDDINNTTYGPQLYVIRWLDKDRFYSTGKDGGKVYIYFQREN